MPKDIITFTKRDFEEIYHSDEGTIHIGIGVFGTFKEYSRSGPTKFSGVIINVNKQEHSRIEGEDIWKRIQSSSELSSELQELIQNQSSPDKLHQFFSKIV
jgi:hypothetical protein